MCGFLSEFIFDNEKITDKHKFAILLKLSKHRGPDSTVIVRHKNYQLGFNRLAILDLSSHGNQPMKSPSGRYHIVFNGEVYNYLDLISSYKLHNLNSTSDTEVIAHLCDIIGVKETIKILNGMFAISIVDIKENEFYLARDFAGIKPLFYGISKQGVVSASQFDQVFKHEWFESQLELRPEIVKEYFGFGYMQAPNTIYESIFQVNPGELVKISNGGELSKQVILQFNKEQTNVHKRENLDYSNVLKDAIKRQLVSDVSVATFLSGGIDSPLISAYAKINKKDIEAFTLKVNDENLNESYIASAYAEHLSLTHYVVSIEKSDMLKIIDDHFIAYSEPFGDYSSIPTYVISEAAKKRHTVMLSGDGADELFFGYPRMLDILNKRLWFKVPLLIRKPLAKITNTLNLTKSWAPFLKDLNDFVLTKHIKLPMYVLDKTFPENSFSETMYHLYTFDNTSQDTLLHQLRWNEFYAHLQRVLIKVDRASMAHSLEVRVPFLDKESINKSWEILEKLDTKVDLKKELKSLLAKVVPNVLINKKKMGFRVPLSSWLREDLKEDVYKHVFEQPFYGDAILNSWVLKEFVQDFFDKKHNNSWGVWHIYSWQKWAKIHAIN